MTKPTEQIENLQEALRIAQEGKQAWAEAVRVREETTAIFTFQRAILNRLVILYLIMMLIHWLTILILRIEKTCP